MSNNRIPITVFNLQRRTLMGLATGIILLIHSPLPFSTVNVVRATWDLLYGVVDVFIFLSGMGLYYSMDKNKNLCSFYGRRLLRIMPQLFLVSVIWLFVNTPDITAESFIDQILLRQFWTTGNRTYWFFNLLFLLYLIYPIVHFICDKYGQIGILSLLVITVFATFCASYYLPQYDMYEIALTRVPPFLVGAWAGKLSKEKFSFSRGIIGVVCGVCAVLWGLCYYGYIGIVTTLPYRYCCGIFCIGLFFIAAVLLSKFRWRNAKTLLMWLGGYSMECYLIYEKVLSVTRKYFTGDPVHGMLQSGLCVVITLVLAVILKKICSILTTEISNIKNTLSTT